MTFGGFIKLCHLLEAWDVSGMDYLWMLSDPPTGNAGPDWFDLLTEHWEDVC